MAGYSRTKEDHLARLRKIEGQVRGLHRMVDEDTYCIDVLTQVTAAKKALERVAMGLLDEHLNHCVSEAVRGSPEDGQEKIGEAMRAIDRLVK